MSTVTWPLFNSIPMVEGILETAEDILLPFADTCMGDDNRTLGGTIPVLGDTCSALGDACPLLGNPCPVLGAVCPVLGVTIPPLGDDIILTPFIGGSISLALSGELILHLVALEGIIPS